MITRIVYISILFFLVGCSSQTDQKSASAIPIINEDFYKNNIRILSGEIKSNSSSELLIQRAQLYVSIHNSELALQDLLAAIQQDSSNAVCWEKLTEVYLLKKDTVEALEAALHAQQFGSNDDNLYKLTSTIYLAQHNLKIGLQYTNHAIELNPTSYALYMNRGQMYLLLQDTLQAAADFDLAFQLADDDRHVCLQIVSMYERCAKYKEAMVVLRKTMQKYPKDPTIFYEMAQCYTYLNKKDSAWVALNACVKADPLFLPALSQLGRLYFDQKEYSGAIEYWKRAWHIDSLYDIENFHLWALAYEKENKLDQAILILKKIRMIDSTCHQIEVSLSRLKTKYREYNRANLVRVDTLKHIGSINRF